MKKIGVVVILLVLSLASLLVAQEEVNIEFPDPGCDPQNYNNKS